MRWHLDFHKLKCSIHLCLFWVLGGLLDVLYIVGPGEPNGELRYSMRSLSNFSHDKVAIAGYKPRWVKDNVLHIDVPKERKESKHANSTRNLLEGCKREDLTEDVLMMHDDMFFMQEYNELPPMHLGPLWDMPYRTPALLPHHSALKEFNGKEPLNYEAHVPMIINRKAMVRAIEWAWENITYRPILKRSIYGHLQNLGGIRIKDVKVRNIRSDYREWALLSTAPNMFKDRKHVGGWIKKNFPDPSPYEWPKA